MDYYSPVLKKKLEVYLNRSRRTIADWLNAYIVAEAKMHARRNDLMEVYDYTMLDNHLKGIIRNRKNKVIGEKWHLTDDMDVPLPDESKLLKKKWFRQTISAILDARFYGYSLIEFDFKDLENISVVDIQRRNVNPEKRLVLIQPTDIYGFSVDDPALRDNYVMVDGEEGLGLLLTCAPSVIYKRYAKAAWVDHAENFALPFLHVKTNMQDAVAVEVLRTNMANAGRERMMLTEHSDDLEAVSMGTGDVSKIYADLVKLENEEMSKNVQGQTMTSDNGSSRSQAEVHEGVADDIALSDREFVENVINDDVLPRLRKAGFPIPEEARFTYNLQREASTDEKVKVYTLLLQHFDIEEDDIQEAFGVRVTKKEVPETLGGPVTPGQKPGKKKPAQESDDEGK